MTDPSHAPSPAARELTLQEWFDLEEDEPGELVDGRLEEEEVPDQIHEILVSWLVCVLRNWLGERGGFVFGSEAKFAVRARRGRKPDVSVFLPGGRIPPGRSLMRVPPDIAVEIVSPRARDVRRDRVEKKEDYAAFGIRWYWIVDPVQRSVEIHELGRAGEYDCVLQAAARIEAVPGCEGLALDLPKLWAEIDRLGSAEADDD